MEACVKRGRQQQGTLLNECVLTEEHSLDKKKRFGNLYEQETPFLLYFPSDE